MQHNRRTLLPRVPVGMGGGGRWCRLLPAVCVRASETFVSALLLRIRPPRASTIPCSSAIAIQRVYKRVPLVLERGADKVRKNKVVAGERAPGTTFVGHGAVCAPPFPSPS